MLEPRRSQYLRAMGVDIYVPRAVLPGAAPSAPCEWELAALAAVPEDIVAEPAAATATAAQPEKSQTPQRVAPLVQNAERNLRRNEPPAAPPSRSSADAVPRFALAIVPTDCGILIVDDAPANAAVRNDYLKLLGNIVFALRGRNAELALDVFAWPMVKSNPQIDQSANAARESVSAYLHKHIEQRGIDTVLLLGAAAQQWAAGAAAVKSVASISAWACLREVQAKRRLWQDLRPLALPHP